MKKLSLKFFDNKKMQKLSVSNIYSTKIIRNKDINGFPNVSA